MSDNEFDEKLDLLVPWDIPVDSQLDIETKDKLSKVLIILLQSLESTSLTSALSDIESALDYLGESQTSSINTEDTKTSLKNWEVTDYDRYFQIDRIQTPEPEIALVRGLLVNTRTFLLLCQKCEARLDDRQIDRQKQGLIAYARLLARNFNLNI